MTTPDPQLVREMAREAAKVSIEDTDYVGIAEQFCDDDRWPADEDAADALHRAIADDLRGAVPTWPDEQARSERDGDVRRGMAALLDAVETFRAWLTDAYDPDAPAPDPATAMYQRAAELRARIAALAVLDAHTTDGGATFADLASRTHLNYSPTEAEQQRERESAVSGGDGGAWGRFRPCADCLAPSLCETADEDRCP